MICGARVRVEFSHGRGRSNRGGDGGGSGGGRGGGGGRSRRRSGSRSPRSRKPYSPHDVCYECGGKFPSFLPSLIKDQFFLSDRGHYAYDCEIRLRRQRRMR